MLHEKVFKVSFSREVKVIVNADLTENKESTDIHYEILARDLKETAFRPVIGVNHPKFWKYKRLSSAQARSLEIEYSGLTRKQLDQAIQEFVVQHNAYKHL